MKIYGFILCLYLSAIESKNFKESRVSTENQAIYPLIVNSIDISPPKYVLLPNYKNKNETISIQYKSFFKSSTFINSSKWSLSVFVDQNYFTNQSNEPLHVMCFLQFSIEQNGNDVGKNASCKIIINGTDNNFISVANCILNIGRSPSICSASFELNNTNLSKWASISAELYLSANEIAATSINQPAIILKNNDLQPVVNWTVVQQDEVFGEFALGLPLKSLKVGSVFRMPISISLISNISLVKIFLEYDRCLSFNGIENLNKTFWDNLTNFNNDRDKESGYIRLQSRNGNRQIDEDWIPSEFRPELLYINFYVTEKPSTNECALRAGIGKVDPINGNSKKYFNRNTFHNEQPKVVNIGVDTVNIVIIVFPQPRTTSLPLFHSKYSQKSTAILSYLLHKSGEHVIPQLIKNITCVHSQFSKGITHGECVPQKFSKSWVLPVQIEHWKTCVFNVYNYWQPESWKLHVSDLELNPVSDWQVYRNKKCVVMYQSAVLKVGVRLTTLNSFGMNTYLGSDPINGKQWIDYTKHVDISLIRTKPKHVVSIYRNNAGQMLINVNMSRSTTIYLYDNKMNVLADAEVSVFSEHWASVTRFNGICISDFDINKTASHPSGEGEFINLDIQLKPLRIGDKCNLYLSVIFNDKTQLMIEDLSTNDYRLEVNNIDFMNGDLVNYQPSMNVTLYGSPYCESTRVVFTGKVDLSRFWLKDSDKIHPVTESSNRFSRTTTLTEHKTEKGLELAPGYRSSLTIAIYCVVSVFVMALLILILNCVVGLNVRGHSLGNMQRRLSKTGNVERKNFRTDFSASPVQIQEHYPPLLPPPGPIIASQKSPTDWGVSSESGIGLERSSVGSQQDPIALSTFRVSIANGSIHPSDSSSYIHQTSPFNDVILESQTSYTADQPPIIYEPQSCISRSYWSGFSSPYGMPSHDMQSDYRNIHDHTRSPDLRNNSDLV